MGRNAQRRRVKRGELMRTVSPVRREKGADEFLAIAESILYEHEGAGHEVRNEVDPETGDRLLICDGCEQVLYLTSGGIPEPKGIEVAPSPDEVGSR